MFFDDENNIRIMSSDIFEKISGDRLSHYMARDRLLEMMSEKLGLMWPNGYIMTSIGAILNVVNDMVDEQDTDLEVDKAYDKNEMNCYQEVVGFALVIAKHVGSFCKKLTPKLLSIIKVRFESCHFKTWFSPKGSPYLIYFFLIITHSSFSKVSDL